MNPIARLDLQPASSDRWRACRRLERRGCDLKDSLWSAKIVSSSLSRSSRCITIISKRGQIVLSPPVIKLPSQALPNADLVKPRQLP